jgi:hypothetical protein
MFSSCIIRVWRLRHLLDGRDYSLEEGVPNNVSWTVCLEKGERMVLRGLGKEMMIPGSVLRTGCATGDPTVQSKTSGVKVEACFQGENLDGRRLV